VTGPALLDAPAATPAAAGDALADLILVRLLPAAKSVSPRRLRADLAGFFRRPPSGGEVSETVDGLRAAGLVTRRGQRLTGAGRKRALAYLGVAALPAGTKWAGVRAKYLVPKALGLSPESEGDAKVLGDADKLAVLLLKRKLRLPAGTGGTLNAVFEAIACRELGYRDHSSLASLVPVLLGKAIGGEPVRKGDAGKVVPRVLLDAKRGGIDGLRGVALAGWQGPESDEASGPDSAGEAGSFDLEAFAAAVKAAARTSPTGRFGGYKVFISHVWNRLRGEPRFAPLGLPGFKDKLVEANRRRLLTLSRADLVQFMDPADVRESATNYLSSVFHFVLIEKE
jgi:hypothetical protein